MAIQELSTLRGLALQIYQRKEEALRRTTQTSQAANGSNGEAGEAKQQLFPVPVQRMKPVPEILRTTQSSLVKRETQPTPVKSAIIRATQSMAAVEPSPTPDKNKRFQIFRRSQQMDKIFVASPELRREFDKFCSALNQWSKYPKEISDNLLQLNELKQACEILSERVGCLRVAVDRCADKPPLLSEKHPADGPNAKELLKTINQFVVSFRTDFHLTGVSEASDPITVVFEASNTENNQSPLKRLFSLGVRLQNFEKYLQELLKKLNEENSTTEVGAIRRIDLIGQRREDPQKVREAEAVIPLDKKPEKPLSLIAPRRILIEHERAVMLVTLVNLFATEEQELTITVTAKPTNSAPEQQVSAKTILVPSTSA